MLGFCTQRVLIFYALFSMFYQTLYWSSFGRNSRALVMLPILRMLITIYSAQDSCLMLHSLHTWSIRCHSHHILSNFVYLYNNYYGIQLLSFLRRGFFL
jgi:hypothetical protein